MGEIKFRVWHKEWEKMLEVSQLNFSNDELYSIRYKLSGAGAAVVRDTLLKPENVKLLRYTGLKDKNGTKIYEGDIVQRNKTNKEVKWFDPNTGYIPFAGGCGQWEPSDCEVLGNIYENPYLL